MKKVLILAYDFPPYVSVGAQRPYNWLKYFHDSGIYPIVVTRQWTDEHGNISHFYSSGNSEKTLIEQNQNGTIISSSYQPNISNKLLLKFGKDRFVLLRKLITGYYEMMQYLFRIGPKVNIYKAADNYLKNHEVDVIIACGDPFVLFKYASDLSEKYHIPWIADYRDPWSEDISVQKYPLLKRFYRNQEKNVLRNVSFITVVSEFIGQQVRSFKPDIEFQVVPNGFDPESVVGIEEYIQESVKLSIGFVGSLNDWHPIHSFLSAIARFSEGYPEKIIHLNFYGVDKAEAICELIKSKFPKLTSNVTFYPKMANDKLLPELAKNNLMLLFNNYSIIGTKIYDYIAVKRKIFLCFTEDAEAIELKKKHFLLYIDSNQNNNLQEKLIVQHSAGIAIKNADHLIKELNVAYDELRNTGFVKCETVDTAALSRKNQVNILSNQIKEHLNKKKPIETEPQQIKSIKLLILAYDFPPYVSVGGLRPFNWFRYLKEYGIEPVVITRQWANIYGNHLDYIAPGFSEDVIIENSENGTILRTPFVPNLSNRLLLKHGEGKFRFLRKAISGYYEIAQFIFPVGPKSELYKTAKEYLSKNKVDSIIATGDPFVLFSYASKLSRKHNVPWIADYRDPWSQSFSAKKGKLQRRFDSIFERKFVANSSSIVTVDELFKLKLNQIFPEKQIQIFPNGYDPLEIEKTRKISQNRELLSFAFIGTIYLWHPLRVLLKSFSEFVKENPDKEILVKFYGTNSEDMILNMVRSDFNNLSDTISIQSKMPNGELLQTLANDNVLLLFNYYQFTGTKIYDYLGLHRKILLCFENDAEANQLKEQYYFKSIETKIEPQIDIIRQTNSGIIVKDSTHLKQVLLELYSEFQQTGMIRCDSVGVDKYSRKIQVERLAKLVKGIASC